MGRQEPMDSFFEKIMGNKEKNHHPNQGKGPSIPNQNK